MHNRPRTRIVLLAAAALAMAMTALSTPALAGSWAPYLDLLKKDKSGGVKAAAIYGTDGAKWAASLEAKVSELPALVAGLKDNSKFQSGGILYGGVKYMFLTARSPAGVVGRKGPNSILLRATNKALLIIITNDGANPANITSIDFVADQLLKQNL